MLEKEEAWTVAGLFPNPRQEASMYHERMRPCPFDPAAQWHRESRRFVCSYDLARARRRLCLRQTSNAGLFVILSMSTCPRGCALESPSVTLRVCAQTGGEAVVELTGHVPGPGIQARHAEDIVSQPRITRGSGSASPLPANRGGRRGSPPFPVAVSLSPDVANSAIPAPTPTPTPPSRLDVDGLVVDPPHCPTPTRSTYAAHSVCRGANRQPARQPLLRKFPDFTRPR